MKNLKRTVAILLCTLMLLSVLPIGAMAANEEPTENIFEVIRTDPESMDWTGEDAAFIDFSQVDAESVPTSGTVQGTRMSLLTGESTGNTRASNVIENGYLLLGKDARKNDNPADMETKPTITGAIYLKLDAPVAEKGNTSYRVRIEYYGGKLADDDAVDGGSYIDLVYNSDAGDNTKTRQTYGTTYQNNADAAMYFELETANFAENIGQCKADFRLETWANARLRIRSISVIPYVSEVPPMTDVAPETEQRTMATVDFSTVAGTQTVTNGVLTENSSDDGLIVVPTQSTGNTRGSNIIQDGYLLLGKQARKNDNPADMETKPYVNGAVYMKLDLPVAEKQGKAYAIKIEYFGGGIGLDGGSYIDLRYHNSANNNNASKRKTFGATYNSGKDEALYYLLTDADFNETINGSDCGGDFRLETWCGNGDTTGAQIRLKGISVVPAGSVTDEAQLPALFDAGEGVLRMDFAKALGSQESAGTTVPGDGILSENKAGNSLTVIPTQSTGNTRGSNIIQDGYLLLGKQARKNDNPADMETKPYVNGAVYMKLDLPVAEKQGKAYAVKIEYFGGGIGLDGGSYIDLRYHNSANNNNASKRKTFGATYNSGKDEVLYYLLTDADFNETINGSDCGGDFRLETWCGNGDTTGAQIRLKGISVVPAGSVTDEAQLPALFDAGEGVLSIDFTTIFAKKADSGEDTGFNRYANDVLNGSVAFDGMSIVTNVDDGNCRAANRFTYDGYLLLGKQARLNTKTNEPDKPATQGRVYVLLDEALKDKQNKAYAVKVDYLAEAAETTVADDDHGIEAEANSLTPTAQMEIHYTNASTNDAMSEKITLGDLDGTEKSAYFLLADANFSENVSAGSGVSGKAADFRLDATSSGNTQIRIRRITVISYDPDYVPDDLEVIFTDAYSGTDMVYVNVTKGERCGLEYAAGSTVYKIIDNNGVHFGVRSVDDLGFKITDPKVKAAHKVTMTIKYWDVGLRAFSVQYNAERPENWEELNPDSFYNYYSSPSFEMYDSKQLVTLEIPIENACFEGKQNGACDFRIHTQYIQDFYIEELSIRIGVEDFTTREPVEFPEMTELNNFENKTIVGYQAWFQASDSQTAGWNHWNSGSAPAGGKQTFDIYPDVSDYSDDILFQTGYANLLNGQPAVLYDGTTEEAIDVQVKWMQDYGIDGFAVSRFYSGTSSVQIKVRNKLDYMKEAAEKYGRLFYMGYDLSGIGGNGEAGIKRLESDFVLNVEEKYVPSPNYAQIDGKPVVSLWGFSGIEAEWTRYPNTENALALIKWFHDRGYYVIGGLPDNNWAMDTSAYAEVYRQLDMVTPWTVGRYNHTNATDYLRKEYEQDKAYIDAFNAEHPDNPKTYLPTIFPGFSWANWATGPQNGVQRNAGEFMWEQAKLAKEYGFTGAFIAMFDEYDEGTSIAKMAEDSLTVPADQYFVTAAADGKFLSSDFYLRLTGAVTKMLRGELAVTDSVPIPHATGPVFWRNGFERRYLQYKTQSGSIVTALGNLDVCVPDAKILTNVGIEDIYTFDMIEDPYGDGFTSTGEYSFNLNGVAKPENNVSRFCFKIADTAIEVQDGMVLQYNLRAENERGGHVFVDLLFDNGKKLSELGAGDAMKGLRGKVAGWSPVTFAIPASMTGHSITSVIVAYDYPEAGEFNAYIDDVVIQYGDNNANLLADVLADAESLLSGNRSAGYTEATVAALRSAIAKAKEVAASSGAGAAEIKAACNDLMRVMNALVAVPPKAAQEQPAQQENPPAANPPAVQNPTAPVEPGNLNDGNGNSDTDTDTDADNNIAPPPADTQTPDDTANPVVQTTPKHRKNNNSLWLLLGIVGGVTYLGLMAMMIVYYLRKKKERS